MGEGTEENFRAASIFFRLIFPTEESFRENPSTSLGEKKIETKLLPRYSLGA